MKMERVMLREFGFIVHVDHPHKLVLNHVNLLHKDVRETALKTRLMQEAFSLTNDRSASPQPVQEHPFPTPGSACCCTYHAEKMHRLLQASCVPKCVILQCLEVCAADAFLNRLPVFLQTINGTVTPFVLFQ